jgi:hypothetical protein
MGKMKEKKGVKNTWAKPIYIKFRFKDEFDLGFLLVFNL